MMKHSSRKVFHMGKAIQFTHNEEHPCHLNMRNHEKRGTLISITIQW